MAAMIAALSSAVAENWNASWIGADSSTAPKPDASVVRPELVIKKAFYGKSGDPAKQIDLSAKLQQAVESGKYDITVGKTLAGGDPAYGVEKTLELEFAVDGKLIKRSLKEGEEFDLLKDTDHFNC